jgi:hypothetical protein
MEIRSIFTVIGLLAATAVAADAYKWLDAEGVVQYSDRPQPGAERIALPTDSRSTAGLSLARAAPPAADQGDQQPTEDGPFRYESLTVSVPGAEETLWNIESVLNVSVALTPALLWGHTVRAFVEGGSPLYVTAANFQLEEVFRGVHNIQVEVIDQTGALMIRSQPNRFYVQQNKVTR